MHTCLSEQSRRQLGWAGQAEARESADPQRAFGPSRGRLLANVKKGRAAKASPSLLPMPSGL